MYYIRSYAEESDRRLESHYLEKDVDFYEGVDIDLNDDWLNIYSDNKKYV
jgi:hypothetical protein